MTTISVPINGELESFINYQIEIGNSETKAGFIRRAIIKMQEEYYISEILEAEKEMKEGKIVKGDLKSLLKLK